MTAPTSTSSRERLRSGAAMAAVAVLAAVGSSDWAHAAPARPQSQAATPPAVQPSQTAEELARQAAAVAQRGDMALAAKMFHAAFRLSQSDWAYLYSAARAEQLAGDIDAARRDYRQFLKEAPADHALRARAKKYAEEVEIKYAEAQQAQQAEQLKLAAAARKRSEANDSAKTLRVVGWVALGVGTVGLGAGAWSYAAASAERADLEKLATPPPQDLIRAISYAEAQSRADAIRGDLRLGSGLMAGGIAMLALGTWLVWPAQPGDSPAPAVAVGLSGQPSVQLGWSF